jgi:hypothetical protein
MRFDDLFERKCLGGRADIDIFDLAHFRTAGFTEADNA